MSKTKTARPTPRKKTAGEKAVSFQARVDYVAKALKRGSWGERFDACFDHHDSHQLIAVVMQRAERSPRLKEAIMTSFAVSSWDLVPWHETAAPYADKSARQIGVLAAQARNAGKADFEALFENPEAMLEDAR
ncbi:hypothetical protein LCGC14_0043920 [marine sediment metagenome]|uniref:Uncharacterized protein n=2 Tax=root TaxID=1 RepID=A0A7V1FPE4_9RHOB|nr:hypothetical protein [Sulfitobacter litoralis]HDZ53447.1 hypothetical protein [Sulfitobacter litoralis]